MSLSSSQIVDYHLKKLNEDVASEFEADVIFIKSAMAPPLDDRVREIVESLQQPNPESDEDSDKRLVVILETGGGYPGVIERMVRIFRKYYEIVEFVIPNYAYSAGTILVMSGDEIHMDYHSVLGPIDPQIDTKEGLLPGMGYISKYKELVGIINKKHSKGQTVAAETAFLIENFEAEKLFFIEEALKHGQSLLVEWLPKWKFKNWKRTNGRKKRVTNAMKIARARKIGRILSSASRWHTHGRGISMAELEAEEINLKICDLESNPSRHNNVRMYYELVIDHMRRLKCRTAIHSKAGFEGA